MLELKNLTGILTTAAVGLGLFAGVGNAGPVFVNPSFEADSWAVGATVHVSPTGWTSVQSTDSRFIEGIHNSSDTTIDFTPFGSQFIILCAIDCNGGTKGSVSQMVGGFTPGLSYRLDFQQSPEADSQGGTFDALVAVTIAGGGSSTTVFSAISAGIPGHAWADWKAQSLTFTANSATLNFTFAGTTDANSSFDIESGIDNIGLTALAATVPEPASITLLGLGLGLVGFGWSRRKKD